MSSAYDSEAIGSLRSVDLGRGEQGREAVAGLFRDRIDVACLEDPSPAALQRFRRAGIPGVAAEPTVAWRVPEGRARADVACTWTSVRGDWRSSLDEILADRGIAGRLPGDDSYAAIDGCTLARQRRGCVEVTATPLPAGAEAGAVAVLGGLAGDRGVIHVPARHAGLLSNLAAAGFRLAGIRRPHLLLPLLQASLWPAMEADYGTTNEDVARFGEATGDLNPIHFDDAYARRSGFDGRIAHGMQFNGWLTRILGTRYPGEGTVFLANATTYLAPVYPGRRYRVRCSVPAGDPGRGTYRVVAQLRDANGEPVVLSYCDVLNRDPAFAREQP